MVQYRVLKIICLLLSAIAGQTNAAGNYVILTPKYLRANHPYRLFIKTLDFKGFTKLHIAVEGYTDSDAEISVRKEVQLKSNHAQLVELDTTTLPTGSYSLRILSGTGGEIDRAIPLTVMDKACRVLIQMDKPIYRPGNTVKFRILIMDQTTRPLEELKTIQVKLTDPDENVIKVWPYAVLWKGVFQSELEISNEPNPGNWTLTAIVRGKDYPFSFRVNDYKAPKYEIAITSPKAASVNDKVIIVDVNAWYTFGKPIKGDLIVKVTGTSTVSKVSKINGSLRMTLEMGSLIEQPYVTDGNTVVNVDVVLLDQFTRKNLTASNKLVIYKNLYQIVLRKSFKKFIPGYPYRCWLKIRDPRGQMTKTSANQAIIVISFSDDDQFNKVVELHLTPELDGTIPLTLAVPEQATVAEIDVSYQGSNEQFYLTSNVFSGAEQMQVSILNERADLNQPLVVEVQSSIPLSQLTYQVLAKGRILLVNSLEFESTKSVQFEIAVTPDMIPIAKIFVFSVWRNKILKDAAAIRVDSLTNWVNVSLSSDDVEPGTRIRLTAESQPKSIIGLLAVAKSTWLLGNENQITKRKVLDELSSFSDDIDGADESIDDMIIITNAVMPTAISARFGDYEVDEEDTYIPPRRDLPESWLWLDLRETGTDGKVTITAKVPESITSWQISAFALSPVHGLGVLDQPVTLNVFKPFFVMINLPKSIKKSEAAVIEVTVFNYLQEMLYVGVALKNTRQEYEFVTNQGRKDTSYQSKNVVLSANSASTVKFMIRSKKMGHIMIKVIAESTEASDSVERLLRVTPESLPYHITSSRYIQLDNSSQTFPIQLDIPRHIDENSENITFSVQGNLLGDSADELANMIRLPTGSGEQNALKMVPCLALLEYLSGIGTIDGVLYRRATKFLTMGYQNELKYKHDDGSFSMRGKEDGSGSVLLTALVVKILRQASRFVPVSENIIVKAYDWLQERQLRSGKFSEIGTVPEYGIQPLHSDDIILTAYTLISFLEYETIALKYKSVIDKGTSFLSSQLMDLESLYAQALIAYALQLAQHKSKDYAFDKLVEVSQYDQNRQLRWWDSGPTSVETTAYTLLSFISRGSYVDSRAIVNWLVAQRYQMGPDNIQTTYVGLQAIAEHSKKISSKRNRYNVIVKYGTGQMDSIHVDPQTSLEVQQLQISSHVRRLEVTVEGTGTGIFSVDYRYNSNIMNLRPRFDIQVQTLNTSTSHYLDLKICARFKPHEKYERTALVLMEITFPSGYIALDDSVEELEAMEIIKKVKTKFEDDSLQLYFESFPEIFQCLPVSGFRQSEVLQQIPGSVRIFDFYDNSRIAIAHFDGKEIEVCDICDDDCPDECKR